jgi:hypothetical protein
MSNKFLEISSTPDNSKMRYINSKNSNSSNYSNMRRSYMHKNPTQNDSSMRAQRMRQSESTKPNRQSKILGKTPSKMPYNRARASSNPRMGGTKEMHNVSSTSLQNRKGKLMSSSKLGKMITDQNNVIMDQKQRIQKIYEPNRTGMKSSSSNIKVADEFPSINGNSVKKSNHLDDHINKRFGQNGHGKIEDHLNKTEERIINDTSDGMINPGTLKMVAEGLMSTEVGRRENAGTDEFGRYAVKDTASHSLLSNMKEMDYKGRRDSSKDNSTFSINTKKQNLAKYDTTAVISEERSNFGDPFTQMYTNTILSS